MLDIYMFCALLSTLQDGARVPFCAPRRLPKLGMSGAVPQIRVCLHGLHRNIFTLFRMRYVTRAVDKVSLLFRKPTICLMTWTGQYVGYEK
jgi:hypothetical protein